MNALPIPLQTVVLLAASNVFMTFAWYGHLKNLADKPWYAAALVNWGLPCSSACCSWRPTASATPAV